jgi:hypothetical protein
VKDFFGKWAEEHVQLLGFLIGVVLGCALNLFCKDVAPWLVDVLCDIAGQR